LATASITHSTDLPVAPEVAWERLTDFTRYGEWNVNHVAFPDGEPVLGPGAEFSEELQVRGAPGEVNWTVEQYEEHRRLALKGKGPLDIKLQHVFALDPTEGGVKFTNVLEFSSLMRPMVKAMSKVVDANVAESVARFGEGLTEAS